MPLKAVGGGESKCRTLEAQLKLSKTDRKMLEAYLDHIGMSLNAFVRRLVLDELLYRRIAFSRDLTPSG